MPAFDDSADGDQMLWQAIDEMAQQIMDRDADVHGILYGSATVTLALTIHDAETPEKAVDRACRAISNHGFNAAYFEVRDNETGDSYYVKAGEVVDPEDLSGRDG